MSEEVDEASFDIDTLNLESSTKNIEGSRPLHVGFSTDLNIPTNGDDQDFNDAISPSKRSPRVLARSTSYSSAATRRRSTQSVKSIQSEANPLAGATEVEKILLRVENLSGCRPISDQELKEMVEFLSQLENNDFLLECLDEQKNPYLFTSQNLLKLVHDDVVTSIKTKLMMIAMIGPRLTDPKAKMEQFLNLFRFAEEKSKVEEILKARASTLTSAIFKQASPAVAMGGRGGRGMGLGGRGGGGGGVRNRSATTVEQTASSSAAASPTRGRSSTSSASYNSGSTGIESINIIASGTEMPSSSSLNGISEDDEGEGIDNRNSIVQKEKTDNDDDDDNDDNNKGTANDENGRESTITANGGGATGILNLLNRPSRAITFTDKPQKSILSLNKAASVSGQKASHSTTATGALGGRPRSSSSLNENNNNNNSPARGRPPTGLQVSPSHYSRTSSAPSMFTSPGGTSGAIAGTKGEHNNNTTTASIVRNINTGLSQNNSQTNLSNTTTIRSGKSSPYMSASNLMTMDNVSETGVSTKTDEASDIDLDHSDKAAMVTSSLMNITNTMNTGNVSNTNYGNNSSSASSNSSSSSSSSSIERNRSQTSLPSYEDQHNNSNNTPVSRYAKEKGNEPPQVEIIGSSVGVGNLLKAFNNNNNNNTNTNQNPNVAPVNMIPILPGRMSMFSGMGGDRYVLGGLTGAQSAALAANDGSGDDSGRVSVNSYFGGNSNNNNNNPSSSSSSSNSKSISPRTMNFIPSQTPYVANTTAAQAILRPKAAESGIIEAVIRVASAVGLEPKQFLTLEPEAPVEEIQEEDSFNDSCYDLKITTTLCLYSYRELVRQNHFKDYQKVVPGALENHLTDVEFLEKFNMSKESFAQLAKWKQNDLKKSRFLF